MSTLDTAPTPALVLDRGILAANLARMRAAVSRHGVTLRPHLKTAKSAAVAELAVAGHERVITVSTVAEAEYFAARGFHDILLTVGITAEKLPRIAELVRAGAQCTVVVDNPAAAAAVHGADAAIGALVEVDCGEGRCGVMPDSGALLEVAALLGDRLRGVMAHAGHSYLCRSLDAVRQVAEAERAAAVYAADRLRGAGHRVAVVSVGSTPTALHAADLTGVTEVRAGVYMFGDLFQAEIGSCTHEQLALTVLASVVGHRREENILILDAGALALSKDRSTERTARDAGFGRVYPALRRSRSGGVSSLSHDVSPAHDDAMPVLGTVTTVYQEHGLATGDGEWPWDALPIGSKVRIAPNHACLTAAAHDRYLVVDGGTEVVAVWDRCGGW